MSRYSLLLKENINSCSVYEEGVGTYVSDFRNFLKGLRWIKWIFIHKIQGCGLYFGEGKKTSRIYVTHPSLFLRFNKNFDQRRKKLIPISGCVAEMKKSLSLWQDTLEALGIVERIKAIEGCIVLVVGTWMPDFEYAIECNAVLVRRAFEAGASIVFVKSHPGMVPPEQRSTRNIFYVNQSIPIEVILCLLDKMKREVLVYHSRSSIVLYKSEFSRRITFVSVDTAHDGSSARYDELLLLLEP